MTKERIPKELEQGDVYLLEKPNQSMEIGDCKIHLQGRKPGKFQREKKD